MREIKFRAWEKNLKEIIPIHSINFENKMVNSESAWRFFDEIELMQYTGLKDKNGKEIYEGDILSARVDKLDVLKCEVIFASPSFCRKWLNENTANLRGCEVEPLAWNTHIIYEVIGNRFVNLELLGVAE